MGLFEAVTSKSGTRGGDRGGDRGLDDSATVDDVREAVTTLEETERIARRVLGGAHPLTSEIEINLRLSRAALAARETPSEGVNC